MARTEHKNARTVVSNMNYVAGVFKISNAELARIMGISVSSLYQRKSQPWTFRIGEFEKLVSYAQKHGMNVTLAQFMMPFVPGAIDEYGGETV